jgi:hypothetical protein
VASIACAACAATQPPGWQPGDRCTQCGAAVRVDQRCAACTAWTPPGAYCRQCAAELLPPGWYGVGRMLIEAGVDRLALAGRARALDDGQREVLSSRFAQQRALVERVVELARRCEVHLARPGHADRLEEQLVPLLPLRAAAVADLQARLDGCAAGDDQVLLAALAAAELPGDLSTLAQLAQARHDPGQTEQVRAGWLLQHDDTLATEAALVVVRAEVCGHRAGLGRDDWGRVRTRIGAAWAAGAGTPELAMAQAWLRRDGRERDDHVAASAALADDRALAAALPRGLADADPVVRLGCARLLGDAAVVEALTDHPRLGRVAQDVLARLDAGRLVTRFRALTDEDERVRALRALPRPLSPAAFSALCASLRGASAAYLERVIHTLTAATYDDVVAEVGAELVPALAEHVVGVEHGLVLLRWAVDTDERHRPFRPAEAAAPLAELVARLLAALPRVRATVDLHGVDRLVAVAERGAAFALVRAWLVDDATAPHVLRVIFHLQSVLACHAEPPDPRAIELLLALWADLSDAEQAALAPVLAEVSRRETGSAARPALVAASWRRFLAAPDQRAVWWRATSSYRRDLEELRDADPAALELDGGDPARRFALYAGLDPMAAPVMLRGLMERAGDEPGVRVLSPVIEALVVTLLGAGAHRHAMWLLASWMSEVVNRFRDDDRREAWRVTAAGLPALAQRMAARRAATTAADPGDSLASFEQQIATELRLADEVTTREDEDRQRDAARAAAVAAREAAARAAQEEEAARAEAARAKAARQLAAAQAGPGADASLATQVLLPDQPLRTLREYVGFLRAMQAGADVMALLTAAGMTPATWGTCATAWGSVMSQRPEVAICMASLLRG